MKILLFVLIGIELILVGMIIDRRILNNDNYMKNLEELTTMQTELIEAYKEAHNGDSLLIYKMAKFIRGLDIDEEICKNKECQPDCLVCIVNSFIERSRDENS